MTLNDTLPAVCSASSKTSMFITLKCPELVKKAAPSTPVLFASDEPKYEVYTHVAIIGNPDVPNFGSRRRIAPGRPVHLLSLMRILQRANEIQQARIGFELPGGWPSINVSVFALP
jgi:hypothetical protein